MAEGKDFKSDIELVEWNKKLKESRETDERLNTFLSRHRSQSAPRGTSDRGRSLSSERRELESARSRHDELARRSRRQLFQNDESEDKEVKDNETEIIDNPVSLKRDRSPLKGKFAETGKKVMSKLKSSRFV